MGTQNRYARMPLPPEHVASHHRQTGEPNLGRMIAEHNRHIRADIAEMFGAELVEVLNTYRPFVASLYPCAVIYRAALHEAVVVRNGTVTWSALTNEHEVYWPPS